MRSIRAWLERLTANAVVATVLGSIPASSDIVNLTAADKAVLNIVHNKKEKEEKRKNVKKGRWLRSIS
jgi:hypothetical protein